MPRLHHRPASDDRSNAVESASLTKPRTPQVKTAPQPAIPHPMDKVKFANGKADYHGATYTIVVHKQDASSVTGLVLKGSELEPPMIKAVKEGGCAAGDVKLSPSGVPSMQVGQLIIAVNGQKAYGHEQASALLRKASGDVAITLSMQASTASQPAAACEDAETASQVKTAEPSDVLYKASIEAEARVVNSLAVAAEAKARAEEAHAIAAPPPPPPLHPVTTRTTRPHDTHVYRVVMCRWGSQSHKGVPDTAGVGREYMYPASMYVHVCIRTAGALHAA